MKSVSSRFLSICILAPALFFSLHGASAQSIDERELDRSAIPDITPEQFYDTAIREAGGAYKAALADCNTLPKAEQGGCRHEATATYRADMAAARAKLKTDKTAKP